MLLQLNSYKQGKWKSWRMNWNLKSKMTVGHREKIISSGGNSREEGLGASKRRSADQRDPKVRSECGKVGKRRWLLDCEDPECQPPECGPLIFPPFKNAIKYMNEKAFAKGNDGMTLERMQKNKKDERQATSRWVAPFSLPESLRRGKAATSCSDKRRLSKESCRPTRAHWQCLSEVMCGGFLGGIRLR